ncbi:BREX-2 system adenine-specific DNA-methyltransferase PglX [Aquariibacter albus]|uniref:BREX-2 system adenine-specific DNA-methyltransferase PglX n=1 Tax=Aquariibacter albus TaxID=2759899 RepID=UPI001F194D6C|nr:BREX-2 system adenine-specific DNA-methyltransferase PglX [Aquariibacter albus]
MVDPKVLLADLTRLLKRLEDDLRERALSPTSEVPQLRGQLKAEWQAARDAERTAETFESWAEQVITQAGVHWLLSCVFLRFIEDNKLVDRPWLSGTPDSGRLALARDRHDAYFRVHPHESDREYLISSFREAGRLPGLHTFFDEAHNPVFRLGISGYAAIEVLQFWREVSADSGALIRDFTDPTWNTRFLGDLYQDLSEATRKRYALLQTPDFVEAFILDRTLTPAIREYGLSEARMIDPTCGSGHFLLGGFYRLVDAWARAEPGRNRRDIAQKALDAVAGVDLNPFAVAIARFRLWIAALQVSDVHRLSEAPDFKLNVAIGDSLLHGTRFGLTVTEGMFEGTEHYAGTGLAHAYASEDLKEVNRILGLQYHAVVGNPPYIVVEDARLNGAYRKRYASCQGQYSLGVPFTERFFDLTLRGRGGGHAGYVGLITTNSFMKREFGPKLVTEVLPAYDLTHMIDTSGAYIPGHGTPTVILLGRNRTPVGDLVRSVLGIKGEPSTPEDPALGSVWTSILEATDRPGFENDFVSATDMPRAKFERHPWRIGGGGAAELSDLLDERFPARFPRGTVVSGTGRTSADEAFVVPASVPTRLQLEASAFGSLVEGDMVRDWSLGATEVVFAPYGDAGLVPADKLPRAMRWLWPQRTTLGSRVTFGRTTYLEEGRPWWGWHQVTVDRLRYRYVLAFGEIATHNHFVLDRGGKVFKQTAPMIKLATGSGEDEYLGLLGLLNSSVACFWLKQVCFPKGGDSVGGEGARVRKTLWDERYAFNATNVAEFPLAPHRPLTLARTLDTLTRDIGACLPAAQLCGAGEGAQPLPTRQGLDAMRDRAAGLRREAVAWQEELDWTCYALYGLLPDDAEDLCCAAQPPDVRLGERAFEIVLARRVAAGRETTVWFERHGSTPVTEIPAHWPEDYRKVVQRRIALIERDRSIALIERPEYKRRWNTPAWEDLERAALRGWLLDRLEAPHLWPASADQPPQLTTVSRLADAVRNDAGFMQIAELHAGHAGFDIDQVVAELVADEAVPFLPVLRYSETGLRKRAQWEATWALQRREDVVDAEVLAQEAPGWRAELTTEARTRFDLGAEALLTPEAEAWVEKRLAEEVKRYQDERKAEEVGRIPVPPRYKKDDFRSARFWDLRKGLDVPKERWVSYPGCERGADGSLPIAWAGWNHLQQAMALASYFIDMKEREGWSPERLQPLLAGLLDLVPWLKQWHNEMNPDFGARMGDYYESFVADEARALQFTLDDLRSWKPAAQPARRGRRRTT